MNVEYQITEDYYPTGLGYTERNLCIICRQ